MLKLWPCLLTTHTTSLRLSEANRNRLPSLPPILEKKSDGGTGMSWAQQSSIPSETDGK